MRLRLPLLFVLLPTLLLVGGGHAQTAAQLQPLQDPRHYDATRTGEVIDLGPLWLFQEGDNPAWAAPNFDDSNWPVVTAKQHLAEQGYPDVNRIWYRTHLRVPQNAGPLDLGIERFYGSYEIFVNGARIGGEGSMAGRGEARDGRLILYGIPHDAVRSGELTIAIRGVVKKGADGLATQAGGIVDRTQIVIGGSTALAPLAFSSYITVVTSVWINLVLVSFVIFVVLMLYRALPEQKEYLYIAVCGIFLLISRCVLLIFYYRYRVAASGLAYAIVTLTGGISGALKYEVVMRLVGRRPPMWMRVLQVLYVSEFVTFELCFAGVVPYWADETLTALAVIALDLAVPIYLFREMLRGNRDSPVLFAFQLVASVLQIQAEASYFLYKAHLLSTPTGLPPLHVGPYSFTMSVLTGIYFWITLLVIIVFRTVRTSREKAEIAAEIAAAKTVQQVLIPDFLPVVPGLTVETAYFPAQEVGGDFFQVLPIPGGASFVVIGDVSGHGLPAAMTVSLLVGALRTFAEFYTSPAELLGGLNRRLHGRGAGFATCLALKITADGEVTAANAGHPNPYLDGVEIATESSFPLGLTLDVEYTETRMQMERGQAFTLVTDGVVEATAVTTRELFGFERTQAISRQGASAIAEAAKEFGIGAPQADDITVLTVARTAV